MELLTEEEIKQLIYAAENSIHMYDSTRKYISRAIEEIRFLRARVAKLEEPQLPFNDYVTKP